MNIIDHERNLMHISNHLINTAGRPTPAPTPTATAPPNTNDFSTVYVLKPYGKPCHIWFTYNQLSVTHNNELVQTPFVPSAAQPVPTPRAFVVENMLKHGGGAARGRRHNAPHNASPKSVHEISCGAKPSLADGDTIFFGYWNLGANFFLAQNVLCYRGNNLSREPIRSQLLALHSAFTHDIDNAQRKQSHSQHRACSLHVPFLFETKDECTRFIRDEKCTYNVYSVVKLSDSDPKFSEDKLAPPNNTPARPAANDRPAPQKMAAAAAVSAPQTTLRRTFNVRATTTADLYELRDAKPPHQFVDYAMVTDYKTSKYMNSLFKNIRENDNLDHIEESDDEADFENTGEDKWIVHRDDIPLECFLHPKFNKWCIGGHWGALGGSAPQ